MDISIPVYDGKSFHFDWEDGFAIRCSVDNHDSILIEANKEGLISLARHLLELAQDNVPHLEHFHLDEFNSLESDSAELIIIKNEKLLEK